MAKAPSAFEIEAALSALKVARDHLSNDDLRADEMELSDALAETTDDVDEILSRLIRAAEFCGSMANEASERIARVKARHERFEIREKVLRQQIADLMLTLGRKRFIKGDIGCRINLGVPRVRVIDPSVLDSKYLNPPALPTVNKRALLADLQQGVVVEGAVLSNPEPFVVLEKH